MQQERQCVCVRACVSSSLVSRLNWCPLHISQSDTPIPTMSEANQGKPATHFCRVGIPFTFAECVHSCRLVQWRNFIKFYYNSLWKTGCIVHVVTPDQPTVSVNTCIKHVWYWLRVPQRGPDSQRWLRNPFTLAEPTASGPNRDIGSANVQRALERQQVLQKEIPH